VNQRKVVAATAIASAVGLTPLVPGVANAVPTSQAQCDYLSAHQNGQGVFDLITSDQSQGMDTSTAARLIVQSVETLCQSNRVALNDALLKVNTPDNPFNGLHWPGHEGEY
jgi:hypothetical protein